MVIEKTGVQSNAGGKHGPINPRTVNAGGHGLIPEDQHCGMRNLAMICVGEARRVLFWGVWG